MRSGFDGGTGRFFAIAAVMLVMGALVRIGFDDVSWFDATSTGRPDALSVDQPRDVEDDGEGDGAPTLEDREYEVGECVVWDQRADVMTVDTEVVPCDEPHWIEISGSIDVADLGDEYPEPITWDVVGNERCLETNEAYLGAPLDPFGLISPMIIHPTRRSWDAGAHDVWCGMWLPAGVGSEPTPGSVLGQSQHAVHPPGTCLRDDVRGSVPCADPHHSEVVGHVTLGDGVVLPAHTDDGAWQALVGEGCRAHAEAYAPGGLTGGFQSGWHVLEQASYDAGARTVHCIVAEWREGIPTARTGSVLDG